MHHIQLLVRVRLSNWSIKFCFKFSIYNGKFFDFIFWFSRAEQPNGEISAGQTVFILDMYHEAMEDIRYYHFIIDDNATMYWVSFAQYECNTTSTISKTVHPGKNT